MPQRTRRSCFLLLLLLAACPLFAQTFNLGSSPQRILSLNGKWRFHPGDNPQWASPSFDDATWPLLKSNESWASQGYHDLSGYAWYRFTLQIPAGSPSLSISLPPIITGYQIYENGHLIGSSGLTHPSFAIVSARSEVYPINGTPAKTPLTVHIALRVWHSPLWAHYYGGGPISGGALIGPEALLSTLHSLRIHNRTSNVDTDTYVDGFLSGIVGLVVLVLFFLRPGEREYLWFALMQLANCASDIFILLHGPGHLLPIPIYDLLQALVISTIWISSLNFFSMTLHARRGFWFRLALLLAVVSPLSIPCYWPGWISVPVAGLLGTLSTLPSTLWILALLARRSLRRDPDALILLAPAALNYGYGLVLSIAHSIIQFRLIDNLKSWVFGVYIPVYPFRLTLATILDILFIVALLIFLIRRFSQARGREEHFNSQLDAARQVQQMLIPASAPTIPGFAIESIYIPADIVGGDFFQQIPDGNGGLMLVVGDVSGKGLPAAMMVSLLVGAIRSEAARTTDPAGILTAINQSMLSQEHHGFATCLVAHLSPNGILRLACAGHIPPFLNGKALEISGSLPIGIVSTAEPFAMTLQLNPGDRLTFISDGILEAQNSTGELFGFERTASISTQPAEEIAQTASTFGQEDDITVLTVEFSPQRELAHA